MHREPQIEPQPGNQRRRDLLRKLHTHGLSAAEISEFNQLREERRTLVHAATSVPAAGRQEGLDGGAALKGEMLAFSEAEG
jgi:hypothetical protein